MSYGYSRRFCKKELKKHPDIIIIIEGRKHFRVFDDSAELLAEILKLETYKDKKGESLLAFPKKEPKAFIATLELLKRRRIAWRLYGTESINEYSPTAKMEACVETGSFVRLKESDSSRVYKIIGGYLDMVWAVDKNGNVSIRRAEESGSKYDTLSVNSPLGGLLIGKKLGDTVSCEGKSYVIENISDSLD